MFKKLSFQKRLFLLLGLLSLSSIAFVVSNLRPSPANITPTPTPPSQIISPDSKISALKPEKYSISPNLTSFPFPSTLPVYSVSPPPQTFLRPLFQQLISLYKLSPSGFSDSYYLSQDKSIIVNFDSKIPFVSYSIDGSINTSAYIGDKPPKLNTALSSAKSFIQQFPDYQNLEPQTDQVTYFLIKSTSTELPSPSDPLTANLITIPFTFFVSGYPYRYSSASDAPALISVAQNNQIVRAHFTSQPLPNLDQSKNYPLLNLDQITAALNNNQGSVLYAPMYYLPEDVSKLPPTTITKINIEYRFDPQINQVIPYYILVGEFLPNTKTDIPIKIQILLPAVKL